MGSSNESPLSAVDMMQLGRAYWLPPYGHGNGLDALFWVCLAEVPRAIVPAALIALRASDIPGWAAPVTLSRKNHEAEDDETPYRLWIATIQFDSAEDVLMRVLNDEHRSVEAQPRSATDGYPACEISAGKPPRHPPGF